jgi:hypothetical protein
VLTIQTLFGWVSDSESFVSAMVADQTLTIAQETVPQRDVSRGTV